MTGKTWCQKRTHSGKTLVESLAFLTAYSEVIPTTIPTASLSARRFESRTRVVLFLFRIRSFPFLRQTSRTSAPRSTQTPLRVFRKRGLVGTYQHIRPADLPRYLNEFDFRMSNRARLGVDDTERTERAVKGAVGKRLTYHHFAVAAALHRPSPFKERTLPQNRGHSRGQGHITKDSGWDNSSIA